MGFRQSKKWSPIDTACELLNKEAEERLAATRGGTVIDCPEALFLPLPDDDSSSNLDIITNKERKEMLRRERE